MEHQQQQQQQQHSSPPSLEPNSSSSDGEEDEPVIAVDPDPGPDPATLPLPSSPLPRLDEFTRYRPRRATSTSSVKKLSPRSPSPPRHRTGPVTIRESREIPILLPRRTTATNAPPTRTRPRTPATQRANSLTRFGRSSTPTPNHSGHAATGLPTSLPTPPATDDRRVGGGGGGGSNQKIHIPKIPRLAPGFASPPPPPPPPPGHTRLAAGLEGMFVDEFGNVLDWEGHVLGRVEGDLPAMVGRPVASTGEIIGPDGSVAGYVIENETIAQPPPEPKALETVAGAGLRVDHLGNIVDQDGKVVGHFNLTPHGQSQHQHQHQAQPQHHPNQHQPAPAANQLSSSATPSPSEIFLDVKSTNDGIQIIMKIPTVFNRGMPNVHIS